MVKGISRQVIVVHTPEPKLFEQAIFILKDDVLRAGKVTDEQLLREANQLLHTHNRPRTRFFSAGPVWACGGAALTGLVWLLTSLL